MSAAAAWRWCVAAGLVAFAASWGFGRIPGLVACGPADGLGPILAFEFARSPDEVAALFGAGPCRSTLIAAQRAGLLLDALAFIPAYTAFLCLAAVAAKHRRSGAVVACLIVAGLADEVEGVLLHAILRDLPGTPGLVEALWWPVHVKFVLLGLGTLGIAALLAATRSTGGRIAAVPVGLGALVALAGLAAMPTRLMTTGFSVAWFSLLAAAAVASLRPSLFSARAAPPPARATPSA